MTNKMILMALGLSVALLNGCGSSDNDTTTDVGVTDSVTTDAASTDNSGTTPASTASIGFTPELLVGKTYVVNDNQDVTRITFSETAVNVDENGEKETLSYVIDAAGVLIVDGENYFTLLSIDANGDLVVENENNSYLWEIVS